MPRIRNLKPEFWDSPDTARADLAVRLLFQAMWNWADDSGRGTANLKELEAFAFPNDDVREMPRKPTRRNSATVWPNFGAIVAEVQRCYGVVFYRVRGRPFFWIPSFKANQSKHFNPGSKLPDHSEGEIWDLISEYGSEEEPSSRNSATQAPNSAGLGPLDRDRDRDRDISRTPLESVTTDRAPARANGAENYSRKLGRELELVRSSPAASKLLNQIITEHLSGEMPPTRGEIAHAITDCLEAGSSAPHITKGVLDWMASDSWSPTQIRHFVTKAARAPTVGKATEKGLGWGDAAEHAIANLREWKTQHGS